MTVLMVPPPDAEPWPTLGPGVCAFIEAYAVYGPGDLLGDPVTLDPETQAIIYRAYEVQPPIVSTLLPGGVISRERNPQAGRRRFKRVALSMRKGTAKTEKAAWLVIPELHPDGPVRCDGFRGNEPIGRGIKSPYIPMIAVSEAQMSEGAYAALKAILERSPLADDFDIGEERILAKDSLGRATSLATSPNSRDGARTTFQVFDETHRLYLPNQVKTHQTMLMNIPKRYQADAWSLEVTTSFAPGEGSVAENTYAFAEQIAAGKVKNPQLFFFHREASDGYDLDKEEDVRRAVIEASGPTAGWSDIDSIVALRFAPDTDIEYYQRVWLNRRVKMGAQAFDRKRWDQLVRCACGAVGKHGATFDEEGELLCGPYVVPKGALVVAGFDGSVSRDWTALVLTEVETGYQWPVGIWEPRLNETTGEMAIPIDEVEAAVDFVFAQWDVWLLLGDPFYWREQMARWAGKYDQPGRAVVVSYNTTIYRKMAGALQAYRRAMETADLSHDGDKRFAAAIGAAQKHMQNFVDDNGERMWTIEKPRSDSPFKIDPAMAGCLSWEARLMAIAQGAKPSKPKGISFYFPGQEAET